MVVRAKLFTKLLEMNKSIDNLKGFNNSLRCIEMKWNSISNKTLGRFPEKLWNFFYATVVVKLREELCHREVSKINAEKERKHKEAKARRAEANAFFEEIRKERSKMWEKLWSENILHFH